MHLPCDNYDRWCINGLKGCSEQDVFQMGLISRLSGCNPVRCRRSNNEVQPACQLLLNHSGCWRVLESLLHVPVTSHQRNKQLRSFRQPAQLFLRSLLNGRLFVATGVGGKIVNNQKCLCDVLHGTDGFWSKHTKFLLIPFGSKLSNGWDVAVLPNADAELQRHRPNRRIMCVWKLLRDNSKQVPVSNDHLDFECANSELIRLAYEREHFEELAKLHKWILLFLPTIVRVNCPSQLQVC